MTTTFFSVLLWRKYAKGQGEKCVYLSGTSAANAHSTHYSECSWHKCNTGGKCSIENLLPVMLEVDEKAGYLISVYQIGQGDSGQQECRMVNKMDAIIQWIPGPVVLHMWPVPSTFLQFLSFSKKDTGQFLWEQPAEWALAPLHSEGTLASPGKWCLVVKVGLCLRLVLIGVFWSILKIV